MGVFDLGINYIMFTSLYLSCRSLLSLSFNKAISISWTLWFSFFFLSAISSAIFNLTLINARCDNIWGYDHSFSLVLDSL